MDTGALIALMQSTPDPAGNVSGFINWSISVGDVLTLGGSVSAVVSAYVHLREKLAVVSTKLDPLWEDYLRSRRRTRE